MKHGKKLLSGFGMVLAAAGLLAQPQSANALGLAVGLVGTVLALPIISTGLSVAGSVNAADNDKAEIVLAREDARSFLLNEGAMTDSLSQAISTVRRLGNEQGRDLSSSSDRDIALSIYLAK